MPVVIGLDPGASGSFCRLTFDTHIREVKFAKLKDTEEVVDLLSNVSDVAKAVVENVTGIPFNPQTGAQQSVHMNFRFGLYTGIGHGLFLAFGYQPHLVAPMLWQRRLGIVHIKNESKTDKKNRHKETGQVILNRSHIDVTLTHWMADAFLIAVWGMFNWKTLK